MSSDITRKEMYVTRSLSHYRANPDAAAASPSLEGPHSGYLVIQDEEYDAESTCCWGLCRNPYLPALPFSQNRLLTIEFNVSAGQYSQSYSDDVFFVPVPGQPLSANRYYVVCAEGNHIG